MIGAVVGKYTGSVTFWLGETYPVPCWVLFTAGLIARLMGLIVRIVGRGWRGKR